MVYPDDIMEVFSCIGAVARVFGRLPLITRYVWNGFSRTVVNPTYVRTRYGSSWPWRPWLLFDVQELEVIEELINVGTDKKVLAFRRNQLEAIQMVSIVGALVAGAALTTQQLPGVNQVSYVARGFFIISLVMSLLATFFTCLQQRTYGFLEEPAAIRAWLTNGVRYTNAEGREVFQSSVISQQLLQAPFELLCISITTFLGGIGVYLGSAMTEHLQLGSENEKIGNRGVLVAFVVGSTFALSLLGQLLGGRDLENLRCRSLTEDFTVGASGLVLDEDGRRSREFGIPISIVGKEDGPNRAFVASSAQTPISLKTNGLMPPSSPSSPQRSSPTMFGLRRPDGDTHTNLTSALRAAAEAHKACAIADAEVARWLEKI